MNNSVYDLKHTNILSLDISQTHTPETLFATLIDKKCWSKAAIDQSIQRTRTTQIAYQGKVPLKTERALDVTLHFLEVAKKLMEKQPAVEAETISETIDNLLTKYVEFIKNPEKWTPSPEKIFAILAALLKDADQWSYESVTFWTTLVQEAQNSPMPKPIRRKVEITLSF